MSDIIQLLPDSVANQIAAGEVIQRPASAVKELLENAVDAGSTRIEVIVKDSGKTLLQVIDNGCGMSVTDARLSFARHATSKIRTAEDIFSIRTKGFRGEALASIAAIAQVELRTRKFGEETGTGIWIEGSEITKQETVSCPEGTSISIRNLFYNVPARRNFLKSNPVEARHIIDEFERVALAHPEISMSLHQNGLEIFKLPGANLRQRIVSVYGSHYNERLVPVQEETTLLSITGFVGKPEFAKKSRGEQFFFVNRRFIKDAYLHHAVSNAFEELLPRDSYASYWLYIDIDPGKIDVNIHPTKTEIKFEDERSVYAIVRAAVKRSLGQYSVAPVLDFEQEKSFDLPHSMRFQPVQKPHVTVNTEYNPFQADTGKKLASIGWEKMYESVTNVDFSQASKPADAPVELPLTHGTPQYDDSGDLNSFFQINQEFIAGKLGDKLLLVDQQAAHERILFEGFLDRFDHASAPSQQQLFPQTLSFSNSDLELLKELETDIRALGFDIREFGGNSYVLHGAPPEIEAGSETIAIESILEQYKNGAEISGSGRREMLARAAAKSLALKKNRKLNSSEMKALISDLLACRQSVTGLNGKPCMIFLNPDELRSRFRS